MGLGNCAICRTSKNKSKHIHIVCPDQVRTVCAPCYFNLTSHSKPNQEATHLIVVFLIAREALQRDGFVDYLALAVCAQTDPEMAAQVKAAKEFIDQQIGN